MKQTDSRGGARHGAGRPRKEYKVALSVRISPEAMTKLNESTNNKSEFINDLILRS